MKWWLTALIFVLAAGLTLLAQTPSLLAAESDPRNVLVGKAVRVHSGDTFVLLANDETVKVRLEEVDAPEAKQLFGPQSRRFLEKLILRRSLRVDVSFIDKYGRRVGRATLAGGRVVNDEVVGEGYAWHYRATPNPDKHLAQLERNAFSHSLGLWIQKHPVPPWEHRREQLVPPAPLKMEEVDYETVLHTGILGIPANKTFIWPACGQYLSRKIKKPVIFLSLHQAKKGGYHKGSDCP